MNIFCAYDWEVLLYIFRIFLPLIALVLWIKGSSFMPLFERITTTFVSTASALLGFWYHTHKEKPVPDNDRVKFHVTSKVENPHSEKVSVKWLISWKSMPENSGHSTSSDGPSGVSISSEPSNGGTNFTFYDSNGTEYNMNTSIQSFVGESENAGHEQNSEENNDPSSGETK